MEGEKWWALVICCTVHRVVRDRYLIEHKLHYVFHHSYWIPAVPWGLCVKVPINNPLPILHHIQNIHLFPLSLRMLQPFSFFSIPFGKTLNLNPQPMLSRTLSVLWLLILETRTQPCCRRENVNTCVPVDSSQTSKPNPLITASGTLDTTSSVFI